MRQRPRKLNYCWASNLCNLQWGQFWEIDPFLRQWLWLASCVFNLRLQGCHPMMGLHQIWMLGLGVGMSRYRELRQKSFPFRQDLLFCLLCLNCKLDVKSRLLCSEAGKQCWGIHTSESKKYVRWNAFTFLRTLDCCFTIKQLEETHKDMLGGCFNVQRESAHKACVTRRLWSVSWGPLSIKHSSADNLE